MIISGIQGLTRTIDDRIGQTMWRCLGRRGMLYSECESFDYIRLAPGAVIDRRGREGTEEAWFVLSGQGQFLPGDDEPISVRAGDLIFCPYGVDAWVRGDPECSLELLLIAVLPAAATERLPIRTPAT